MEKGMEYLLTEKWETEERKEVKDVEIGACKW